jgi:serine/threonine protein kinase
MDPKHERDIGGAKPQDIKPKGEEPIRKASEREAERYEPNPGDKQERSTDRQTEVGLSPGSPGEPAAARPRAPLRRRTRRACRVDSPSARRLPSAAVATARKEKESGDEVKTRHRKVGPYRILGPLGKGGMAQVFRGLHEALQREVAIKELLPEGAANKDTLSRFRREALALASMRHQNVVAVYDLVDKAGAQFLILELVDGPTLHELLRDAPLPPMVAAVVGAQMCAALEHAHFHRIIHRDLKPANVMLGRVGEVKLMDFGIARDEDLGRLTQTGMASERPPTCPRSRSPAPRWTTAPTCTRSGCCSTNA